jgi:hypothetical protein
MRVPPERAQAVSHHAQLRLHPASLMKKDGNPARVLSPCIE